MKIKIKELVFGPVPSRRLGRSLGINNVPDKTCSYSCIYCQAGKTTSMTIERSPFYDPKDLVQAVDNAVKRVGADNIDYITFVPNGEPTLDVNLGRSIELLKREFGIRIAVISNSSLLWRQDVREELIFKSIVGEDKVRELVKLKEGLYGGSHVSAVEDILSTISVHPLSIDRAKLIAKAHNEDPESVIRYIIENNLAEVVEYNGGKYLRKIQRNP